LNRLDPVFGKGFVLSYELIPIGSWRAQLRAQAQTIKDKVKSEGRCRYTPEEEAQMDLIADEYHIALTIENMFRKEFGAGSGDYG